MEKTLYFGSILAGVVLSQTAAGLVRRHNHIRTRTKELEHAAIQLERHYIATDAALSDPALPDCLFNALLDFNDTISNEKMCFEMACEILVEVRNPTHSTGTGGPIMESLDKLRRFRGDLADTFERAVGAGWVAMLLRWDTLSPMRREFMETFAANPRKEIDAMSSAKFGHRQPAFVGRSPAMA